MLSADNTILATGGDDTIVRVYGMSKDFKTVENRLELKGPTMPVTGVDIFRDNSRLIASSKDANCYVFDLKTKQII